MLKTTRIRECMSKLILSFQSAVKIGAEEAEERRATTVMRSTEGEVNGEKRKEGWGPARAPQP